MPRTRAPNIPAARDGLGDSEARSSSCAATFGVFTDINSAAMVKTVNIRLIFQSHLQTFY